MLQTQLTDKILAALSSDMAGSVRIVRVAVSIGALQEAVMKRLSD